MSEETESEESSSEETGVPEFPEECRSDDAEPGEEEVASDQVVSDEEDSNPVPDEEMRCRDRFTFGPSVAERARGGAKLDAAAWRPSSAKAVQSGYVPRCFYYTKFAKDVVNMAECRRLLRACSDGSVDREHVDRIEIESLVKRARFLAGQYATGNDVLEDIETFSVLLNHADGRFRRRDVLNGLEEAIFVCDEVLSSIHLHDEVMSSAKKT